MREAFRASTSGPLPKPSSYSSLPRTLRTGMMIWNSIPHCRRFRIIIGRDFGITRKAACRKVIEWLPEARKFQFKVADQITGFHPKAVFWKEANGDCFAII